MPPESGNTGSEDGTDEKRPDGDRRFEGVVGSDASQVPSSATVTAGTLEVETTGLVSEVERSRTR